MADVVVDRSLILPAVCSGRSKYRALLALFRYGRASLYARSGTDETQLTEELAGAVFKGPPIENVVRAAEAEKAAIEEQLGHAPDGWRMMGSRLLFDSYQRTILKYAPLKYGLELDVSAVYAMRQKLVLTASGFVPDADLVPIIPYTDRRETDIAIHTALVGGADVLVTINERLAGVTYTHPDTGATVRAIGFDELVDEITTSTFDFSQIPPQLW